jgi:hypothetical protein
MCLCVPRTAKNGFYTEGSFDFGFQRCDVGNLPQSDIKNPTYTEGSPSVIYNSIFCIKTNSLN